MAHVRFTPSEYGAIAALCRAIHLRDECFPIFRYFLAEALHERWPELAARIALFGERQLRLLFQHLQRRRGRGVKRPRQAHGSAVCELSEAELGAVARAARCFVLRGGRRSAFRDFLLHYFGAEAPALAAKLSRLCARRMAALYRQVRRC